MLLFTKALDSVTEYTKALDSVPEYTKALDSVPEFTLMAASVFKSFVKIYTVHSTTSCLA